MTERELLERFINFIYYTENKSNWILAIDSFLEAIHKEYEPVEFKRKNSVIYKGIEIHLDSDCACDHEAYDGEGFTCIQHRESQP